MGIPGKIQQIVESTIFDYAKHIGVWKGYDVYRFLTNDSHSRTGIPVMVLMNQDGECRYSDIDETFEIYDHVYA